jgi:hypothetical protein
MNVEIPTRALDVMADARDEYRAAQKAWERATADKSGAKEADIDAAFARFEEAQHAYGTAVAIVGDMALQASELPTVTIAPAPAWRSWARLTAEVGVSLMGGATVAHSVNVSAGLLLKFAFVATILTFVIAGFVRIVVAKRENAAQATRIALTWGGAIGVIASAAALHLTTIQALAFMGAALAAFVTIRVLFAARGK